MKHIFLHLIQTFLAAILLFYLLHFNLLMGSRRKPGYRFIVAGVFAILLNRLVGLTTAFDTDFFAGSTLNGIWGLEICGMFFIVIGAVRWLGVLEGESKAESEVLHRKAVIELAYSSVDGCTEDTTEFNQLQSQLMCLGLQDSLTGVGNRTYFEQQVKMLETEVGSLGLIMCDIDGLKLANDSLGQEFGNTLLIKASRLIQSCFRENDIIARIGGDEFAILLPNVSRKILDQASSRMRQAMNRINENQVEFPLSISIGHAFREDLKISVYNLWKEAEDKMYKEQLVNVRSRRSMLVQTLSKAMEARDFLTEDHAERLQELAAELGKVLNLPEESIIDLRLLAQFHDVGKVGVPDSILFKPGPLSPEELIKMRTHCEIGHRIALASGELAPVADRILHHHEWWNGRGYPIGLRGEDIPLECRILAIVDAYDSMTHDRPYRKAMSHQKAVQELKNGAGTQFDPKLVGKFLVMIDGAEV